MKTFFTANIVALATLTLVACDDDDDSPSTSTSKADAYEDVSVNQEEYYTGGELGTTFITTALAYTQESKASEQAGFSTSFQYGETFFERDFNTNTGNSAFKGLGPLYIRSGCLYCHPNYGHGKRQTEYKASQQGNGYLLVIYDATTNAYIQSLAGMPQTKAVPPFKAPIDEDQISIEWLTYTDEWGNKFDDGETYELIYPEVTIPASAYYVPLMATRNGSNVEIDINDVAVRLESTIGIYGTGLLDAIPEDSITAQWAKEESYGVSLNPSMFANGQWTSLYAKNNTVKRFTYAMTRSSLQDGAGANAIWNITNVTRSNRRTNYLDLNGTYYATVASQDEDVKAEFATYFPEIAAQYDNIEDAIYYYLIGQNADGTYVEDAEMSDQDYTDFMVWHRGLAVPAARNLDDNTVKMGKALFTEIGCANCHRPSWTTGEDHIIDPDNFFTDSDLPRYPNQKIWPYTDMVQHRLFMENDIRTGWCRTTPLWGRGLSLLCTGADDRLHDCRARSVMEAIMWHGNANSDARSSIENFRALDKEERDAIIAFVEAI